MNDINAPRIHTSRIYTSLLCVDTQELLWIGQGEVIYSFEAGTMVQLNGFLQRNKGFQLLFVDNDWVREMEKVIPFYPSDDETYGKYVRPSITEKGVMFPSDKEIYNWKNIILDALG